MRDDVILSKSQEKKERKKEREAKARESTSVFFDLLDSGLYTNS